MGQPMSLLEIFTNAYVYSALWYCCSYCVDSWLFTHRINDVANA